ncbi:MULTISPECIES: 3'(2'),5'-bisphosphate nucleotidase CysQ [Ramlibacter]|uniref:3'(2'),5'-bisphosphate nucleotidase CysQ n=1 Tax=Ramlibacter aquaticus TaxID=2780094 RepID=A0ABR9SHZ8_9BURK|nr:MULTISPECIES: 3'(2'),5'-bisphosphate nucleotidase CysQ [Ramlibacter]MBE7941993.1 3'(2'),5'-bisphosphate nucleotidase CysQ [Ramlibacter aquaticus]
MRLDRAGLERVGAIARDAGREIMAVYAGDFSATRKADDSPLTEADLRADRVIRSGLEREFPGVFILSEESVSAATEPPPDCFFLVDPLDGTREFLKRNGEFTVNIALVAGGEAVAGVVLAPVPDALYLGGQGVGAWRHDSAGWAAIRVCPAAAQRPLRVTGSRSHGGEALRRWLDALAQPHDFVAAGSSLKFCRLAEGAADAYPRFGPTCQWDTAAGQAVLEAAGGRVLDPAGQPLRYGLSRPILNTDFLALGDPSLVLPPV